ncbi:MAG: hypothetical protein Fur005_10120 [Roseiflexaceae bacterium]
MGWRSTELRLIFNCWREPFFWLSLLVALLAGVLAYQQPFGAQLAIGGDPQTRLRGYDTPFLDGVNAPEPDRPEAEWWQLPERAYRWVEPNAFIMLPAVGGDHWITSLTLGSGRPDGSPIMVQIQAGTAASQTVVVPAGERRFLFLSAAPQGNLQIQLQSPAFAAPGDSRDLGVVLYQVSIQPLDHAARAPALGQVALQLAITAALYLCLRQIRLGARAAWAGTFILNLTFAWLIATDRLGLTIATPGLAWLALACLFLLPILKLFGQHVAITVGLPAQAATPAMGIALAGFALRLAGVTHPYTRFSDLGFHVNNLLRLIRGEVFLLAGLPCEAGAGQAPYPPAQYLTLAPFRLLLEDGQRWQVTLLVQAGVALLEALGAYAIWLLLRRVGSGQRAALFGAALYLLPLPLLRAYSIGEMANLFGQVFVPLLLLVLACWPITPIRGRGAVLAMLLVAFMLLSHTGVTISAVALLAGWGLIRLPAHKQEQIWWLAGAAVSAGAIALLLFYSAYAFLPESNRAVVAELASQGQICPPGRPFGQKVLATIGLGIGAQGALAPALLLAALIGGVAKRTSRIGILLLAALLGTLFSFATLLSSDQPVRWAHFLFPALCVAAGVGFAAWWRRGLAGRLLAIALLASVLSYGAIAWIDQLAQYLH